MNALLARRQFLSAAATSAAGVALSGWADDSAVPSAPAAAGAGPSQIIDAHTHFYDPTRPDSGQPNRFLSRAPKRRTDGFALADPRGSVARPIGTSPGPPVADGHERAAFGP